ncbi:MAG TPA: DUF2267 domain-containing protein [Hyphomicrobiaceae bacterium]|nr:DUF2267 domain-containing protein [Hyphomicrobiaceae bacterium]
MSYPATIAHTVQQTQEWLKQVRDYAELPDEEHAYSVLRAVLHQLRDRLTLQEAFDLAAQLPTMVRGIYFEAYQPVHEHPKIREKHLFFDSVAARLQPHRISPETAVRAVFATLASRCDPGEIADVIDQLPSDIKALWPKGSGRKSS